ncbi:hypothetical protein HRI_004312500 [Hibiscus trionum]|uniref:Uncharacterized protein n=1 Tax=Hibiscus trionum TaxID=183268 RepID=A0A9W7J4V4_HIBTR|nr:hypothetical protein HRI_004312500 [Hibiscus trionum]
MGCCFSSTSTKPHDPPCQTSLKRQHSPLQPPILHSHKTPSPPRDDEEEAVIKEVLVLSETPKPAHDNQQENITQTPPVLPPPSPPKTETQVSRPVKEQQQQEQEQEQEASHISQQSEIYSVSETITTTTTTTTTATECFKEDEATSKDKSQLKHKSPAKAIKKRPNNGDPPGVRARRESARGRGRGPRTVQRNVGSRSRSPGTGRAGGVSNGAVGKSSKTDKKTTSRASATVEGQSKREEDEKNDVSEQQQGTESIENPHVSLECFIFL